MFRPTHILCGRSCTNYARIQFLKGIAKQNGGYLSPGWQNTARPFKPQIKKVGTGHIHTKDNRSLQPFTGAKKHLQREVVPQFRHTNERRQMYDNRDASNSFETASSVNAKKKWMNPSSNDTYATAEREPRKLWFSDPYLLAEKLTSLINKDQVDEAYDLLRQHTGAGNDDVHGVFFNALVKRKHYEMVLHVYKNLKAANRHPPSQVYTSVLHAIASMANAVAKNNDSSRAKLFNTALDIWNSIDPNIIQTNAMLNVCAACGRVGGWDMAETIYSHIKFTNRATLTKRLIGVAAAGSVAEKAYKHKTQNSSTDMFEDRAPPPTPKKVVIPDNKTYTILIGMYADMGGSEAYFAGYDIWTKANLHSREMSNLTASDHPQLSPLSIDGPIIAKYLLLCIRSSDVNHTQQALDVVYRHFGFPKTHQEPYDSRHSIIESRFGRGEKYARRNNRSLDSLPDTHVELTQQTLTLLLHLALRLRYPALGQCWYDIAVKELHMAPDDLTMHAISTLLLSAKQFDQAWALSTDTSSKYMYQIGLRATSLAVMEQTEDKGKWLNRSRTLYNQGILLLGKIESSEKGPSDTVDTPRNYDATKPIFGFRELLNHLGTTITCKAWTDAGTIVIKNRIQLVDQNIKHLERLVERKMIKEISVESEPTRYGGSGNVGRAQGDKQSPSWKLGHTDVVLLRKGLLYSKVAMEEYISRDLGNSTQLVKAKMILHHIEVGLNIAKSLDVKIDPRDHRLISPELHVNSEQDHKINMELAMSRAAYKKKASIHTSKDGYKISRTTPTANLPGQDMPPSSPVSGNEQPPSRSNLRGGAGRHSYSSRSKKVLVEKLNIPATSPRIF
ncbi:hypothetical protein BASA50_011264 [Batrachochytrium salamandrivorans]|uniref:Pentatricopeptide repeat domain-containing protein n=1 Tax=Batrachochytrium salamandrivorans TaxID=1357716 RepID=A0ABQ8EWA7_9FUNG|nr:hypothetical protein BASA60_001746 [Batrachochytrium salamandrivorans]KAH6587660.1 hypothetical protein BASA50_011264 [Batrachochytrium salamandrivorans]